MSLNAIVDRGYDYDGVGRLIESKQKYITPNLEYTTAYGYTISPLTNQRTVTYPGGRVVTENYDDRLRMDDIGVSGLGTVADWTYNGVDRTISALCQEKVSGRF